MASSVCVTKEDNQEAINKAELLGDRIKSLEEKSLSAVYVSPTNGFILRLDGRSFSKFTKPMIKPFDMCFSEAMMKTMYDLTKEFSCSTGYTHSDEITLFFSPHEIADDPSRQSEHPFGGKVSKLLSTSAGFASTSFFINLIESLKRNKRDDLIEYVVRSTPHFDSRIIVIDDPLDFAGHAYWRSNNDCFRNCISTYARNYYSSKELFGVKTKDCIKMLEDKGITLSDIPFHLKNGCFLKFIRKESIVTIKGEEITVTRKVPHILSFDHLKIDNDTVDFLLSSVYEKELPKNVVSTKYIDSIFMIDLSEDAKKIDSIAK